MAIATELAIDSTASALQMADAIFGAGITVNSATYSGDNLSSGIYTGADTTTPGVAPSDTGVIFSTGYVRDFTNSDGSTNTNQSTGRSTNTSGVNNDPDFQSIAASVTRDASFLEATFVPTGNLLTLDFVIASEEYPEYANSAFNDVVGVWVNGVQAMVTIGDGSASIGNINGNNPNIYNDNTGDAFNTEMDGFTITLTFVAPVNVGVENTIKIGVADVGDSSYDTNLLIAGNSAQTAFVAQDDIAYLFANTSENVNVLANDVYSGAGTLSVTQINGISVVAGDSVTLVTGQVITLNVDGTLTVVADGNVEVVYFNYTVSDGFGQSDTALVKINQVPCFVGGTKILTTRGDVLVEDLTVGDNILTVDNGPQPIRWIGCSQTVVNQTSAPIVLKAGSFGLKEDLRVSPQHRILLRSAHAEMLFGEHEVLVKAKDLVNDSTIRVEHDAGVVDYYHLMFDSHQLIYSNGIPTESYYPGPVTLAGFDVDVQREILELFPELCLKTGDGYSHVIRPALRSFEAQALAAELVA